MKNVLVLGASMSEDRYSNIAMRKLKLKGFSVFSIGIKKGNVESMEIKTEQFSIENLYAISVYLNATNQKGYYDYILQLKPEKVIFNPGSENKELEILLDQQGIPYEEACTLVLLSLNQL
jgi:predicted CoA-binding protein